MVLLLFSPFTLYSNYYSGIKFNQCHVTYGLFIQQYDTLCEQVNQGVKCLSDVQHCQQVTRVKAAKERWQDTSWKVGNFSWADKFAIKMKAV
jgi:hypothetical protein